MTHATIREISDQPAAIDAMIDALSDDASQLGESVSPGSTVCITGCGTSYFLSLTGAFLLNQRTTSLAIPGGEVTMSPGHLPDRDVDIIIGVSRSGESTDTILAIDELKSRYPAAPVIGLTCTKGSELDEVADVTILSPEGSEESVVMTKSYSSMLVAFEYLANLVATGDESTATLDGLATESQSVLDQAEPIAEELGRQTDLEKSFFLGTGEYYGLALEGMLKFEEMTLSWTKAYPSLEFRHGPQSIAGEDTLVTMLVPERRADLHRGLIEDIGDLGATRFLIGTESALDGLEAEARITVPQRDVGQTALHAPPLQYLAYYRAVARGLNPDRPKNLSQVVTF